MSHLTGGGQDSRIGGQHGRNRQLAYKSWKISQMKNNNNPKEMEKITIDDYPNSGDRRILKLALGN